MASKKKEKFPGEHIQEIADRFLLHKRALESAQKKVLDYRLRLNPHVDERLNDVICIKVMDKLLKKSLKRKENKLRDALGHFYNVCQGMKGSNSALTPDNVIFVNEVFLQFTKEAPKDVLNMFDLDRDDGYRDTNPSYDWKRAVGKGASKYIPLFEATFDKLGNEIYKIDPLLFFALMRRESKFDYLAVSPVGAVGLTQIMPKTGKGLGMKNIYMPEYFGEGISLVVQERKTREQAKALLFQIDEGNKIDHAKQARALMQESIALGQKRERLFAKYRRELLKNRTDDRLEPAQAIEYGFKYFARMMKAQGGDISLALASYNAGPHRVKQFKGIPPYTETVFFRNAVLKYYREYLAKAAGAP